MTLAITPSSGVTRWPTRDQSRVISLWHSIAAEKCRDQSVLISDGPFAIQLQDHCTPFPGTTDCGFVTVSGDFSCGR